MRYIADIFTGGNLEFKASSVHWQFCNTSNGNVKNIKSGKVYIQNVLTTEMHCENEILNQLDQMVIDRDSIYTMSRDGRSLNIIALRFIVYLKKVTK